MWNLLWISILILYFIAFRLLYLQFKLAKILRNNGFKYFNALSLKSHDNIKLARNYAKQLEEEETEESSKLGEQSPKSNGNQVWAYGQYASPEAVRAAMARGEITRVQAIKILGVSLEPANTIGTRLTNKKEVSEELIITAKKLEYFRSLMIKIVVISLIIGIIAFRMNR